MYWEFLLEIEKKCASSIQWLTHPLNAAAIGLAARSLRPPLEKKIFCDG
jgi:hypothetical protein